MKTGGVIITAIESFIVIIYYCKDFDIHAGMAGAVRVNMALQTAGAIGGTPGSPMLLDFSALGTMCTST